MLFTIYEKIDSFEEEIAKSEDNFMEAVKYAIIGNVIGLKVGNEIEIYYGEPVQNKSGTILD